MEAGRNTYCLRDRATGFHTRPFGRVLAAASAPRHSHYLPAAPRRHTLGLSGTASRSPKPPRIKASHRVWGWATDNSRCRCIQGMCQARSSPCHIYGSLGRTSLDSRGGPGCNETGVIRCPSSERPLSRVTRTRPGRGSRWSPRPASACGYAAGWHPCHVAAGLRPPRGAVPLHAVLGRFAAAPRASGPLAGWSGSTRS